MNDNNTCDNSIIFANNQLVLSTHQNQSTYYQQPVYLQTNSTQFNQNWNINQQLQYQNSDNNCDIDETGSFLEALDSITNYQLIKKTYTISIKYDKMQIDVLEFIKKFVRAYYLYCYVDNINIDRSNKILSFEVNEKVVKNLKSNGIIDEISYYMNIIDDFFILRELRVRVLFFADIATDDEILRMRKIRNKEPL